MNDDLHLETQMHSSKSGLLALSLNLFWFLQIPLVLSSLRSHWTIYLSIYYPIYFITHNIMKCRVWYRNLWTLKLRQKAATEQLASLNESLLYAWLSAKYFIQSFNLIFHQTYNIKQICNHHSHLRKLRFSKIKLLTQCHKATKYQGWNSSLFGSKPDLITTAVYALSILFIPVTSTSAQSLLVVRCLEYNEHSINFIALINFHKLLFILSSFIHFTPNFSHFRLESFQIKEHTPHTTLLLANRFQHLVKLTTCRHWHTIETAQFLFPKKYSKLFVLKI